jgi:hypothetical protein
MLKAILFAVLAACGVPSTQAVAEPPPEQPDKKPPGEVEPVGQHFCCVDVDEKTFSGEGCVLISEQQVALCENLLYCDKKYVKKDGTVTCE